MVSAEVAEVTEVMYRIVVARAGMAVAVAPAAGSRYLPRRGLPGAQQDGSLGVAEIPKSAVAAQV